MLGQLNYEAIRSAKGRRGDLCLVLRVANAAMSSIILCLVCCFYTFSSKNCSNDFTTGYWCSIAEDFVILVYVSNNESSGLLSYSD